MVNKLIAFLLVFLCLFISALSAQNAEVKQSLFFKHDSYQLTDKQLKIIDSLQTVFAKDSIFIQLKGYTNNLGTKNYNLKLSNKRVASVKDAFSNALTISGIGYGELQNSFSRSRRVDVIISVFNKKEPIIETEDNNILNLKEEIVIGEKYILKGVLFSGAEDVFLEESLPELEILLAFMKSNTYKVKLLGHICCGTKGRDGLNKRTGKRTLSVDRAKAVYNYLIENGIDRNRMTFVGLAGKFPTGKIEVKYDRRVEIEILSLD